MNPLLKFLAAARSLASQGFKKEQIYEFARQEFGEINELMQKQIDNIFNPKKPIISRNKPLDPDDVLPNYNETPGEFARRETPGSKENLLQELKIAYEKEFNRLRGDETAEELKEILKNLDTDGVPFATGGRAGYYGGGITNMVGEDLSEIGHGSDSLMARNMQLAPNSMATTSTGLNYLLGQDNDTARVPYGTGKKVKGPNPKVLELMLNEKMSYEDAEKEFKIREKQRPYIEERMGIGPGPILEAAEGGRIGYNKGKLAKKAVDEGRRGFLKTAGSVGAGIAALKTGLLGFADKAVPVVEKVAAAAGEVPTHFLKLVEKITKLGEDITQFGALSERQIVKKFKDFEMTTDTATGKIEIVKIKPNAPGSDNFGNGLTEEVYMSHTPGEQVLDKNGKYIKSLDEYEEGTAYIRNDGPNTGDVYEEVSGVTDDIFEEVGEKIPEAIRKGQADGGRIGYSKGKLVKEGIPALIKKIQDKFGKNSIKVLENEPDYGLSVLNDYTIPRPESAVLRDKMKNFGKPGKFNEDGSIDYDYYADLLNHSEDTVVYGDEPIEELLKMEKETLDNYNEMKAMYDSGAMDKYAPSKFDNVNDDQIAAAVDDIFPSGDYKYDAEMAAEALVENNPQIFKDMLYEDLDDITRSKIYSSVLEVLSGKNAKMLQMKRNLSNPTKTLESMKSGKGIDMSDPDIADEFAKFMKENDPKGYKDMEQKIQLESFDPKKTKGNAEGGRIGMLAGGGILKVLINNLAKEKGMTGSELLKIMNWKNLPSKIKNLMKKEDFDEMKKNRTEGVETWKDLMISQQEMTKNIDAGMNTPAAGLFKELEKTSPGYGIVPRDVANKDILQMEQMIKNMETKGKGRKLNATGGLAAMLGE